MSAVEHVQIRWVPPARSTSAQLTIFGSAGLFNAFGDWMKCFG